MTRKGDPETLAERRRAASPMGYRGAPRETRVPLKKLLARDSQVMGSILHGRPPDSYRPGGSIPPFTAGGDGHAGPPSPRPPRRRPPWRTSRSPLA